MVRTLITLGLLASAAACSSPAERISVTLQSYGLDAQRADCVGEQLERSLSTSQLMSLGKAARDYRSRAGDRTLSFPDLLSVGSGLDPAIQTASVQAGMVCAMPSFTFSPRN